ncbi:MAG: hypothetical protein GY828_05765, partial [Candidatus Gracilibacteria bacterium]|nr:hypothetical protein [Candidatus Gracilibacteria bacterium]
MKKIIVLLAFFSLISINIFDVYGDFLSNSISIKRADNVSLGNNITVDGNGDTFEIRMNLIPDSTESNNDYKVILSGLPTNLTASGYTLQSDTCTTTIKDITHQDNTFSYTYTANGGTPCNAIVSANYITNNTPDGSYDVSYTIQDLSDDSLRVSNNSASLTVNNLIRIIKAQSVDADNDGYIEQYDLTFNQNIGANSLLVAQLEIYDNANTATNPIFTKTGDETAELTFDDGIFFSGDTPTIEILSTHNSYESGFYNLGVLEDMAKPVLLTLNTQNYSGSDITISTLPSTLEFEFSEIIREDTLTGVVFELNNSPVSGVFSLDINKDTLIFTPSSSFTNSADYEIEFNSQIIDLSGNVLDTVNVGMTLGTVSSGGGGGGGGGSSGGGGGGSSVITPDEEEEEDLEETATGTTEDLTDTSGNTQEITLENIEQLISENVTHPALLKISQRIYSDLIPEKLLYFSQFDNELRSEYQAYIEAYYHSMLQFEVYITTKSPEVKKEILSHLPTVIAGIKANRDLSEKYIVKNMNQGHIVYSPKNTKIADALQKIQTKITSKLFKLLNTGSIDQQQFDTAINAYNDFILELSIFVEYRHDASKTKALEALKIFYPFYKIAIIQEPIITTPVVEIVTETYGDSYTFPYLLKQGDYHESVGDLQEILLQEGYFDYAVTKYYGPITSAALKDF